MTLNYAPITNDDFEAVKRGSKYDATEADALFAAVQENGSVGERDFTDLNDARKAAAKAKRLLQASPAYGSSGLDIHTKAGRLRGQSTFGWSIRLDAPKDAPAKGKGK
jgi:hypothetical protein